MKIVSLFLALALTAVAADTPMQLSRLYQAKVPSDSAAEFYAVQREIADIYKTNKAPIPRLAWTSVTGESLFVTFVPLSGLEQLGERTWLSQQGEERSRMARQTRLSKASGPSTAKVVSAQEEASWTPDPKAAPSPYIVVSIYSVKPGKVSDFLALAKEATAATKKIGKAKSVYVARVHFGGDAYEFHVVHGYASLADVPTGGAFRTAMGEAAYTAYVQKMGTAVNSLQREILRFRPEFSYVPAN